jgi:hypothetical protein
MLLYHGTDGRKLDNILKVGLRPRGRGKSNWDHNGIHSNARCVYLTDSYAPYFAFNAASGKVRYCAVVEVDTDRLDEWDLFPDEDFLEQASRGEGAIVPGSMKERTLHYRRRQFDYDLTSQCRMSGGGVSPWWRASLDHLGTCAHRDVIPPEAITRAVRWPMRGNGTLMMVWDPTITMLNQRIMGDRYKALTAKLMAGTFTTVDEMKRQHEAMTVQERFVREHEDPPMPVIEGWEVIQK